MLVKKDDLQEHQTVIPKRNDEADDEIEDWDLGIVTKDKPKGPVINQELSTEEGEEIEDWF